MIARLHSFADLLNFFSFDPTADAAGKRKGATGEAVRPKEDNMHTIAQPRSQAKELSFGIGNPGDVTDLSVALPEKSRRVQAEAEARAGYRHIGRIEMSLNEWDRVPANPRQRDTEEHAKKSKHLREYDPIHRFVSMAVLPNGDRYKIDGHTRSYLWAQGSVVGPETVTVDVYACDSKDIVEAIYSRFDSQSAVETGADKIAGAARRHDLFFESGMLKSGRYGSAIKRLFAYSTKNWARNWGDHDFIYDAVGFYANELRLLDQAGPTPKLYPAGIIMASLATLRRHGAAGLPFWKEYSAGGGTKVGFRMCGVQALTEAVTEAKEAARSGRHGGGGVQALGLLSKGILAFEAKRHGQTYKAGKGGGIRNMREDVLVEYLRHSMEG